MIKAIWALIWLNGISLVVFITAIFVISAGKKISYEEKGWTTILVGTGLLLILLAAVPLRFSQSTFTIIFSGFFASLPLVIALGILISKKWPVKKAKTFAQTYYSIKSQRAIAASIEQNDTLLLRQLIIGQDLNIQGNRVWDQDGLNYLQFAVRLRSRPIDFPFDKEANIAAIRILVEQGVAVKPALAEACQYLDVEDVQLLLDAGADPNCPGFQNLNPLIFEMIGDNKKHHDIAILLIQKGADVNAIKDKRWTPVMFAAERTDIVDAKSDGWRLVRYLLEKANADILYQGIDGNNFPAIINKISLKAQANSINMPADFVTVVSWLRDRGIDITHKYAHNP